MTNYYIFFTFLIVFFDNKIKKIIKKEMGKKILETSSFFFTEFVLNGEFMVLVVVYYITHTSMVFLLYIYTCRLKYRLLTNTIFLKKTHTLIKPKAITPLLYME
jgi:hypothetical protein